MKRKSENEHSNDRRYGELQQKESMKIVHDKCHYICRCTGKSHIYKNEKSTNEQVKVEGNDDCFFNINGVIVIELAAEVRTVNC